MTGAGRSNTMLTTRINKPLLLVLVTVFVFAGCSDRSTWSEVERLAEPLTFDNALAADQNLEDKYWATMQDELGIVLSDETRTDRYGTWHPLTLAADAPVLDIDPGMVSEDFDPTWTERNVQTAWQAMAEFLVNEQLDSELVWDDSPENRQLLVGRAKQNIRTSLWKKNPEALDYYMNASTSSDAWLGPRFFDQNNDAWRETGGKMDTEYLPAQPAAYVLDRPRTLVSSLALDSVAQGEDPGTIDMAAEVHYCRPIRVDTADDHRYECRIWNVTLTLLRAAGEFEVVGMSTSWRYIGSGQKAAFSDETRLRLPLLEPTPVDDDWSVQQVGELTLSLPPSAVLDTDGSCDGKFSGGDQLASFVVSKDSSGKAQCLGVFGWDVSADGPVAALVGSNERVWYAQAPGLAGAVSIGTYPGDEENPAFDIVNFLLADGPGAGYKVIAEVPAGIGEEFARHLLATFDATVAPA